ncbi:hypothetical protein DXG01_005363 [Tephrocybe rancida]|nr:hypothetical protein DXG01_005363 [Tephrocybe rancida]
MRPGSVPIERTPLPKLQLLVLYSVQFAEPLTSTVVLPFVNQFVRDTGVTGGDERKTGYYAGLLGTAFFLSEGLVVFHWGRLSDRVGRRPVLLLGPIGLALAMLSFGASTKFWMLVATRCAQGVFNGNIGVAKTVIAEITDPTNLADAFAMMPLTWSIGTSSGLLTSPFPPTADRPLVASWQSQLKDGPVSLKGFLTSPITPTSFPVLRQTLPSAVAKQEKRRQSTDTASLLGGDSPGYGAIHESTSAAQTNHTTIADEEATVPFRGLLIPQILKPLLAYSALAFVSSSTQVLLPLMYSTSIPVGGLGFDAYRIGIILSAFSFVNAFVQLFLLAKLVRRFGPRTLLAFVQCGYAINIGIYPVLGFLVRRAGRVDSKVWTVVVVQLASRLTNGLGWGGWTSDFFCTPRIGRLWA